MAESCIPEWSWSKNHGRAVIRLTMGGTPKVAASVSRNIEKTLHQTSCDKKEWATPEQDEEKNILEQYTEQITNIMRHLGMLERQKKICIKYLESSEYRTVSPYIPTMNWLDSIISTIVKSGGAEFQKKMSDWKNDLLEWKEFLWSEAVLALNTFLANQLISSKTVWNTQEEIQGHIDSYRTQGLNYIRSVMCVKKMNWIKTQGHINFDPEKRVTKKLDSLKVSPPDKRWTVEEIWNIIDFINFLLQQVDLILEKNQLESNRTKEINDSNRPKKNFLDSKEATRVLLETLITFFKENSDTEFSKADNAWTTGSDHITNYQRAITLLAIPVTIDGVYWPKTILAIQKFQINHKLNWRDGAPRPETTRKILEKLIDLNEELQKQETPLIEVTIIPESPETQIEKYLTKLLYTRDNNRIGLTAKDRRYIDKDGNFTVTIINGKVEFKSNNFLKNRWLIEYSPEETEIMNAISAILKPPVSK